MRIAFRILALFLARRKQFVTQQKEKVRSSPYREKYTKKAKRQSYQRLLIDLHIMINNPQNRTSQHYF